MVRISFVSRDKYIRNPVTDDAIRDFFGFLFLYEIILQHKRSTSSSHVLQRRSHDRRRRMIGILNLRICGIQAKRFRIGADDLRRIGDSSEGRCGCQNAVVVASDELRAGGDWEWCRGNERRRDEWRSGRVRREYAGLCGDNGNDDRQNGGNLCWAKWEKLLALYCNALRKCSAQVIRTNLNILVLVLVGFWNR